MNNTITIQLNASALEKLIELQGGDEFILTLRRATIENVLRGRSKALMSDTLSKALEAQIKKEILEQVGGVVNTGYGAFTVNLQPQFKGAVEEHVRLKVSEAIRIAKESLALYAKDEIARKVEELRPFVDEYIAKRVDAGVAEYACAEVKRRLEIALKG